MRNCIAMVLRFSNNKSSFACVIFRTSLFLTQLNCWKNCHFTSKGFASNSNGKAKRARKESLLFLYSKFSQEDSSLNWFYIFINIAETKANHSIFSFNFYKLQKKINKTNHTKTLFYPNYDLHIHKLFQKAVKSAT